MLAAEDGRWLKSEGGKQEKKDMKDEREQKEKRKESEGEIRGMFRLQQSEFLFFSASLAAL